MNWHYGTLAAFDLETTGVDPETARVVTACVVSVDGTGRTQPAVATWLANPGVEIPAQAAEIHGVTTERARAEGRPAAECVREICTLLAALTRSGLPLVAFNATYDLTVLDRECRRYGLPTLTDRHEGDGLPLHVVDPFVLDKHVDKWRKGSRKLVDQCTHYGVRLDGAHDASHDALAAARVAWRIAQRHPHIAAMDLHELHAMQVEAKAEQDEGFAAHLRKLAAQARTVDEQADLQQRAAGITGHWPLIPYAGQAATA